jgi:signal transduction histidine kinase
MKALLAGLIGCAAWYAYRGIQWASVAPYDLRRNEQEFLEVANNVETFVGASRRALAKLNADGNSDALARLQELDSGFSRWLTNCRERFLRVKIIIEPPFGMTVDMSTLLVNLQEAAADFEHGVASLEKPGRPADQVEEIKQQVEAKARRLEELGLHARAQAEGIHLFLEGATNWFAWLRRLMQTALLTLLVVALWLALVVYRRVVKPLRTQLVETQAVIQSQRKLVHFGELAAMVAHEIRNPLAAISTRLFTLQRSLKPGSREDADAALIRNEVHRLDRIVRDFLESAQPSTPVLAPMTAAELFEQVGELLRPTCQSRNIELKVEKSTEAKFLADKQQLTQVLINLIQNAADSIGQDGTIRLRARQESRRANHQPPSVLLEVEDNGPGIPPDIQPRLFDPFFSTKPSGTGLGLSIAARIVSRHSGTISFRSQPGRTLFTVGLPVHEPQL